MTTTITLGTDALLAIAKCSQIVTEEQYQAMVQRNKSLSAKIKQTVIEVGE
jgi:hypothetical protein